jgi:acylglycerol lipase
MRICGAIMILERTESIVSFDGVQLFFRCFTPKNTEPLKGLILAVHGFAEHSGRYADLAEEVCARGVAWAGFDLRGHGKSGPHRGDAQNLHAMVLDVLFIINHAKSFLGLQGNTEIFFGLFGHSFGGLLCTYAASILRDACPPVFLSSPLFDVAKPIPPWKKLLSKGLPQFLPKLPVPVDMDPSVISENPQNNAAYVSDELNLTTISARFGELFLSSLNLVNILESARRVKAPVTLCYAGSDKLVSVEKIRQVSAAFPKHLSQSLCIEKAGHEVFNETKELRELAVAELMRWIDTRGLIG